MSTNPDCRRIAPLSVDLVVVDRPAVLSRIDLVLMREILRMNLAARGLARIRLPRPAGSVVASGPGRLDVFMVGSDAAMYHKAWDGTAWLPDRSGFHRLGGTAIST